MITFLAVVRVTRVQISVVSFSLLFIFLLFGAVYIMALWAAMYIFYSSHFYFLSSVSHREREKSGRFLNVKDENTPILYNSEALYGEPGSSVSTVSDYGLDDRAIEVRSPAEAT
jgi:hypothetical protein